MLATAETELTFAAYQERQHHEISPGGLRARAALAAPGGRARFERGAWTPLPYPGHAVVAMADAAPANARLAGELRAIQRELGAALGDPAALYPLPAASFHQTIANTLSDARHRRLVVERGLAAGYPASVAGVFAGIPPQFACQPLALRLIGLGIFRTALGVLGVFDAEEDFERVLRFREHFYRHPRIAQLGIRRTRPFIGHVTLAYLEKPLADGERTRLAEAAAAINRSLDGRAMRFELRQAELRAYDHLAEFKPLPGLPAFPF